MSPNKKKVPRLSEDGYENEMAKKSQLSVSPKKWSIQSRFNSFLTIFMALVIILAISLTAKNGNSWAEEAQVVTGENSVDSCNLFSGKWVYDNATHPLYSERKCTFMSDQSACEKFGRKNLRYQNWRWQPHGCELPRYFERY